MKKNR